MSGAPYAGSPIFGSTIPIGDDSGPPTAAIFNPGLQGLADRTAYLKGLADNSPCQLTLQEFLGSGSFTAPAGAYVWAFASGCGGGGSGGSGGNSAAATQINAGGGGGGGALLAEGYFPLVAGEIYDVAVGDGGSGTIFGIGNPGGDTTITRRSTGDKVFIARGAGGGHPSLFSCDAVVTIPHPTTGSFSGVTGSCQFVVAHGGRPTRPKSGEVDPGAEPSIYASLHLDRTPQAGGIGVCCTWNTGAYGGSDSSGTLPGTNTLAGRRGNASPQGFEGGAGGVPGAILGSDLSKYGGGAGGGGGAGPFGAGAAGGNGSDGTGSTASASPTAGSSASANTGAGGGGGGGAGDGTPTTTSGASPGDGGSGRVRVCMYVLMVLP